MKKILVSIAALLLVLTNATAQKDTLHILFKGVQVNGPEDEFTRQLIDKQYTCSNGQVNGKFAGYDVSLHMEKTKVSGMVYMVAATLHPSSWKQAKTDYIIFKANMSLKYGQPASCTEIFTGAYRDGDGYELKALSEDACRFCSEWNTTLGRILIEINYVNRAAAVTIIYEDAINAKLNTQEKTNIFLEDL